MVATVGSSSRPYSKGGKRKRLGFQNLGAWQRGPGELKPLRRLALVHWCCHLSTQRTDPWVWCPHRSQENSSIQLGLLPGSLVGVLGWRRQNCFCTCYKLDSRTIDKQLLLPRVKKVRESAFSSQENAGLLSSTLSLGPASSAPHWQNLREAAELRFAGFQPWQHQESRKVS